MHNFRKIITHTLLLLVFVTALLVGSMAPYFYGETYYYQDYKVRKKLSGQLDTLIVGSSHALRSVKPTILNDKLNVKAYNLSSPLMSMYGRYVLLEKEVKRNPIKTVYIELSYNALTLDRASLGLEGDLYVLGRLDNISERLKFSKEAFSSTEYTKVFTDTIQRSTYAISNFSHSAISQQETYGYLPVPSIDQTLKPETKEKILNSESLDTQIKADNLEYFNKFIKLCKENDIRIIIIVTPISDRMVLTYNNMDDLFSQYIDLAEKNDCEYYDFNLDKKRKDLYSEVDSYYDITHLSETGADTFSIRLSEIITQVDEGKDVSKEFYESYDKLKKTMLKIK